MSTAPSFLFSETRIAVLRLVISGVHAPHASAFQQAWPLRRGFWREAWNSAQLTCCTGHRAPLLLER